LKCEWGPIKNRNSNIVSRKSLPLSFPQAISSKGPEPTLSKTNSILTRKITPKNQPVKITLLANDFHNSLGLP
jgi:hypothetical protein